MTRVKVTISYSWEFNSNQWEETKAHWETIQKDLESKISYDPVSMFFCLRNIEYPSLAGYKVEKLK